MGEGKPTFGTAFFLQQLAPPLHAGTLTSMDSPLVHQATAGLLPEACRVHSASRLLRGMATLGGESIYGDPASEVAASLLALNAIYVVSRPEGPLEVPALRFLKDPAVDLAG